MKNSRKSINLLVLFPLVFSMQACTRDLNIDISITGSAVVLSFWQRSFLSKIPKSTCVARTDVYEQASGKKIWTIVAANGACVETRQIGIGVVPKGFNLGKDSSELVGGRTYYATVIAQSESGQSPTWTQPELQLR